MESDRSIYDPSFNYRVGEIVKPNFYGKYIHKICSNGIHYFKTKEAALSWFYDQDDQNFPDGKWTEWRENGQKSSEGTFKNGNCDGIYICWDRNGQKQTEGTYKNGKLEGKLIYWHENGQKASEQTYKNGKPEGKLHTYKNGERI